MKGTRMNRWSGRLGWIVAAAAIALNGSALVIAQQSDPAFQGRILQRSDGTLYVVKDGAKYWVMPADVTDDQIAAIPEAGPAVERIDRFFGPPPPPPPTPTPAPSPIVQVNAPIRI